MAASEFVDDHTREGSKLMIEEEFKFLIPPLSAKEYSQLIQNILRDGCTDPIKVWAGHNIILDGHTRYEICAKNGIEYKTHPIALGSKEEAISWIIGNQLGRRNLTKSQESYLRGKRYNTEKKVPYRPEKGDQSDHLKTSKKIAAESKVGSATVRRDAKYAAAIDSLKQDAGQEFCKNLLTEEKKLPRSDILKLAAKPIDERKALIAEIQQGAKRLPQAEVAVQIKNAPREIFESAGSELEFADYVWDTTKLDAPKNTQVPQGSEIKQKFVYLRADIFEESFTDDDRAKILQVMRESPQWIFMVHTDKLELLEEIDWPANVCLGCKVDSQSGAERAWEVFREIKDVTKFVICDLHKESIAFDGLSAFNWVIIANSARTPTPWQRVESIVEQALADSVFIYWMPNVTVRPKERPRVQVQEEEHKIQELMVQEQIQVIA